MLEDNDPFPFGKHKGTPLRNVPARYLDWLDGQPWSKSWPEVLDYIDRNRKAINQELERAERE